MPHLTLEYTNNLPAFDQEEALLRLNRVLSDSGHFDEVDIKSRAVVLDRFVIGISPHRRAFVHVTLALMSGRPAEVKSAMSKAVLQELQRIFPVSPDAHLQLCVEVVDINQDTYEKAVVEAGRSLSR